MLGTLLGFWKSRGCRCSALPPQLLKKIKRCERKGSESVTEEKCAVLFSTNVTLTPSNISIHLQVPAPLHGKGLDVLSLPLWDTCAALGQSHAWLRAALCPQVLSLPIVVIVHGNQDNNAKATVLWDNAFSDIVSAASWREGAGAGASWALGVRGIVQVAAGVGCGGRPVLMTPCLATGAGALRGGRAGALGQDV